MVTVLSIPLGWVGWELDQRRREKSAIAWVEKMGGHILFPNQLRRNDEKAGGKKRKTNGSEKGCGM